MSKCIILSRVSTAAQELDSQTQAIVNEALKQGFSKKDMIVIEDVESAIKLSEEERNGLNKMKLSILQDKEITHVFIYELSRLSRRQLVLFSIRDFFISHNIQLICCTPYFQLMENGKMTQVGNLMFSIYASMAESEMALKKERMRRGQERNKANGKNNCGRVLYGYKTLEDKTIVIDEKKADFIREIFIEYSKGNTSMHELADNLLARYGKAGDDEMTFFKKIHYIIRHDEYCGNSKYPQLIERQIFEKCQKVRAANKNQPKHWHEKQALLKHIIYDKSTGRKLTYEVSRPKYSYLGRGSAPCVNSEAIDKPVLELARILHRQYLDDGIRLKKIYEQDRDQSMAEILNTQNMITAATKKLDDIEESCIFGRLSRERADLLKNKITNDIEIYENKIEQSKTRLERATNNINMIDNAKPIDYQSFTTEQNIELIRSVIEKVMIEKPSRLRVKAEVYTKVDNSIYVMDIETRKKTCSMKIIFH